MVTAEGIDNLIATANANNGRVSPITGMGDKFIQYGRQYGVNPAVVAAIMMRESQLGADGSVLPSYNNFSGITAPANTPGSVWLIDRYWRTFSSPEEGIRGAFVLLNQPLYRSTGGRLEDVMMKYSPPSENDWAPMWNTFANVGLALGTEIGPSTNIYTAAMDANSWVPGPGGSWSVNTMTQTSGVADVIPNVLGRVGGWLGRGTVLMIGLVILGIGLWRIVQAA
jgi:hypothetical protein